MEAILGPGRDGCDPGACRYRKGCIGWKERFGDKDAVAGVTGNIDRKIQSLTSTVGYENIASFELYADLGVVFQYLVDQSEISLGSAIGKCLVVKTFQRFEEEGRGLDIWLTYVKGIDLLPLRLRFRRLHRPRSR